MGYSMRMQAGVATLENSMEVPSKKPETRGNDF